MSTELAMNSYVLLGNSLNYVVQGDRSDTQAGPSLPTAEIESLYQKIEPLPPAQILSAVVSLSPHEKNLLAQCCCHCLRTLTDDELTTKLGLPRDVAEGVLTELSLDATSKA